MAPEGSPADDAAATNAVLRATNTALTARLNRLEADLAATRQERDLLLAQAKEREGAVAAVAQARDAALDALRDAERRSAALTKQVDAGAGLVADAAALRDAKTRAAILEKDMQAILEVLGVLGSPRPRISFPDRASIVEYLDGKARRQGLPAATPSR